VASLLAFAVLERWVPRLASFSVGILLGAALLNLLPEAIEAGLAVGEALAVALVSSTCCTACIIKPRRTDVERTLIPLTVLTGLCIAEDVGSSARG